MLYSMAAPRGAPWRRAVGRQLSREEQRTSQALTLVSLEPTEERGSGFSDEGSWPKIPSAKVSSQREEKTKTEEKGYEESTLFVNPPPFTVAEIARWYNWKIFI